MKEGFSLFKSDLLFLRVSVEEKTQIGSFYPAFPLLMPKKRVNRSLSLFSLFVKEGIALITLYQKSNKSDLLFKEQIACWLF